MKRQLYLYLFICSALIAAFTYMYYNKQMAHEKSISLSNEKSAKDTINLLINQLSDADSFSLEKNEYAQNYFEGKDVTKLVPQIREALLAYNDKPEGNIYTGQEKLGAQKSVSYTHLDVYKRQIFTLVTGRKLPLNAKIFFL